jgi:Family of unknown function (DUF6231)
MTISSDLSKIILPFIEQFHSKTIIVAGETAIKLSKELHDTRSHALTTPFSLEQLADLPTMDLAIISELTETLTKELATQWLGILRNRHVSHIIVISEREKALQQGWQLTDFLAMGFKLHGNHDDTDIFSYAIESYQPKRDWLNARFWANPENYNKYRW